MRLNEITWRQSVAKKGEDWALETATFSGREMERGQQRALWRPSSVGAGEAGAQSEEVEKSAKLLRGLTGAELRLNLWI